VQVIETIDEIRSLLSILNNDTVPRTTITNLSDFYDEREVFGDFLEEIGISDLKAFGETIANSNDPNTGINLYDNYLLAWGFCNVEQELYDAFVKAHKIVSEQYTGAESMPDYGGTYSTSIDAMHFGMNTNWLKALTSTPE
jgi:hypothetical protein